MNGFIAMSLCGWVLCYGMERSYTVVDAQARVISDKLGVFEREYDVVGHLIDEIMELLRGHPEIQGIGGLRQFLQQQLVDAQADIRALEESVGIHASSIERGLGEQERIPQEITEIDGKIRVLGAGFNADNARLNERLLVLGLEFENATRGLAAAQVTYRQYKAFEAAHEGVKTLFDAKVVLLRDFTRRFQEVRSESEHKAQSDLVRRMTAYYAEKNIMEMCTIDFTVLGAALRSARDLIAIEPREKQRGLNEKLKRIRGLAAKGQHDYGQNWQHLDTALGLPEKNFTIWNHISSDVVIITSSWRELDDAIKVLYKSLSQVSSAFLRDTTELMQQRERDREAARLELRQVEERFIAASAPLERERSEKMAIIDALPAEIARLRALLQTAQAQLVEKRQLAEILPNKIAAVEGVLAALRAF